MHSDPNQDVAYTDRCSAYDGLGNEVSAVPDCEQALRLNPGSTAAHIDLGVISIRQKKYADAVAQFDQTIALAPGSATALLDRGIAYELLGSRDAAIADYQNALKIDPALPAAQAGLKRLGIDPAAPGAQ